MTRNTPILSAVLAAVVVSTVKAATVNVVPVNVKANEPGVCEVGGQKGLFLPLFGDDEARWPDWLQVTLYMIGLFWCFMGVAIIADVFMGAIEAITSKKKRVLNPVTGKESTVKVWNDTVANLTLMALGSSAPEILLNVKEIFENKFYSGALGPMTIVGSAAFNLMCIIAVCVSAIPSGESRIIKDLGVYTVTASFSIFAYLWLLFILIGPTPDRVDVVEGVLTFAFFPLVVCIAYLADIGKLPGTKKPDTEEVHSEAEREQMTKKVKAKYGDHLSEKQIAALTDFEFERGEKHSRAYHRVNATRALFRGKVLKEPKIDVGDVESLPTTPSSKDSNKKADLPVLGFEEPEYVVLESQGEVSLKVVRAGKMDTEVTVHYTTVDGSATEGGDYTKTEGDLVFKAGESQKLIKVAVVDDPNGHEETEDFFVELSKVGETDGILWGVQKARVNIVDENHPGKLAFEQEQLQIKRPDKERELEITVLRKRGWDGKVSVEWCTENESAVAGADYEAGEGTLDFDHLQRSAKLKVKLLPKDADGSEVFRVILKDPTGKAMFDETTDGGKDQAILTVFLQAKSDNMEKMHSSASTIFNSFKINRDQVQVGNAKYKDQFRSAIYCNGDAEGMAEATVMDWVIHIIALPWKFFFAFVPPTEYMGGWACFFVALGAIGVVTILIGDLASMLGCSLGISPFATAITFVALGTSLPDTFASKSAAVQDETADASVGNVTGSNSVNVFLGLGLPWSIGAIYWATQTATPGSEWYNKYPELVSRYPEGAFVVKSDGVGLSVAVFSGCSVTCIATLALRRKVIGAELGGPNLTKWATSAFFVLLWGVYIGVSIAFDKS